MAHYLLPSPPQKRGSYPCVLYIYIIHRRDSIKIMHTTLILVVISKLDGFVTVNFFLVSWVMHHNKPVSMIWPNSNFCYCYFGTDTRTYSFHFREETSNENIAGNGRINDFGVSSILKEKSCKNFVKIFLFFSPSTITNKSSPAPLYKCKFVFWSKEK